MKNSEALNKSINILASTAKGIRITLDALVSAPNFVDSFESGDLLVDLTNELPGSPDEKGRIYYDGEYFDLYYFCEKLIRNELDCVATRFARAFELNPFYVYSFNCCLASLSAKYCLVRFTNVALFVRDYDTGIERVSAYLNEAVLSHEASTAIRKDGVIRSCEFFAEQILKEGQYTVKAASRYPEFIRLCSNSLSIISKFVEAEEKTYKNDDLIYQAMVKDAVRLLELGYEISRLKDDIEERHDNPDERARRRTCIRQTLNECRKKKQDCEQLFSLLDSNNSPIESQIKDPNLWSNAFYDALKINGSLRTSRPERIGIAIAYIQQYFDEPIVPGKKSSPLANLIDLRKKSFSLFSCIPHKPSAYGKFIRNYAQAKFVCRELSVSPLLIITECGNQLKPKAKEILLQMGSAI